MTATANWYPDPENPTQWRYWNGFAWTQHRAPRVPPSVSAAIPAPTVAPVAVATPDPATAPPPVVTSFPVAADSPYIADRSHDQPAVPRPAPAGVPKVPFFGARALAKESAAEIIKLRADMERLGLLDIIELEQERERLTAAVEEQRATLDQEAAQLGKHLGELREQVLVIEEIAILQEAGIYEYRHPLSDSIAYRVELAKLQDKIKTMARKNGGAIQSAQDWTVNGSQVQGRKMVNDFSKLMLRAYNAEADNLVRGLKPYKLESAEERLDKVATTIAKLGTTMSIGISLPYHQLRLRELALTADFQEKLAAEKDREREERARLREEHKVQQEIERERERLEKERQHYVNALRGLTDEQARKRLEDGLRKVEKSIDDVDYRAANIRAGYVYVISNVGAFGDRMIKVGMTRRLEPMERVRELGDASVPFKFDVHALFFSADAVGIETEMHKRLADRRVNRVNLRREFFHATPGEARSHLSQLAGELLTFEEQPEAIEYHQSMNASLA